MAHRIGEQGEVALAEADGGVTVVQIGGVLQRAPVGIAVPRQTHEEVVLGCSVVQVQPLSGRMRKAQSSLRLAVHSEDDLEEREPRRGALHVQFGDQAAEPHSAVVDGVEYDGLRRCDQRGEGLGWIRALAQWHHFGQASDHAVHPRIVT